MDNEKFAEIFLKRYFFIDENTIKDVKELLKDKKKNVVYAVTQSIKKIHDEITLNSSEKIIYRCTNSTFKEGKKRKDETVFIEPRISYDKGVVIVKEKNSNEIGINIYKVIVYIPEVAVKSV